MKNIHWIKPFFGTIFFFAVIFISAGKLNYWQGIIYVAIGFIMFLLNYTVFRVSDELLKERSKPGVNTKKWDKIILGFSLLCTISMYVVAGLDSGRYNWSPLFNKYLYVLGVVLTISGQLLFLFAQSQNSFFSSTVRIQTDREHVVCDKGLYKMVRHPAYLGSIIQAIGFPLIFGSIWSIIPIIVLIILLIIRTHLEDKTLKKELKGYIEYSEKTKYKMFPYVW